MVYMRLLLVEDEAKLGEYLRKGLAEEGYTVDVAVNGIDGLHLAMEMDYDLIVLDGMLPGIDGFAVLAALRQSKSTPVLMLTARSAVEDRVRGLQIIAGMPEALGHSGRGRELHPRPESTWCPRSPAG